MALNYTMGTELYDVVAMNEQKKEGGKAAIPPWCSAPFTDFLDDFERLGQIDEISARGISMLRATPRIVEVLMKVHSDSSDTATVRRSLRT